MVPGDLICTVDLLLIPAFIQAWMTVCSIGSLKLNHSEHTLCAKSKNIAFILEVKNVISWNFIQQLICIYNLMNISMTRYQRIQNFKFPEEEIIQNKNEFSSSWIPQRWSLFWHDLLLVSIHPQNVSVTAALLLQTFSTLLLIYDIGMIHLHTFRPSWSSAIFF